MSRAGFTFTESWRLAATPERVQAVLVDLERYPQWWPQVRAVARIDDDTARVLCRSALPHTLDLVLRAQSRAAGLLEVTIDGDLRGAARWRLAPDGAGTHADYRQEVEVTGRWAGAVSRAAAPVMRWNHARMMAGCREGLTERLRRGAPAAW